MDEKSNTTIDERRYSVETPEEVSPVERIMQENDKLLMHLEETVISLRGRVRTITSSALRNDLSENAAFADEPRVGSSAVVDSLYLQRARIRSVTQNVQEILSNLEV